MMRAPSGHPWLRDLNPGYFALVMATGIVSRAAYLDGATLLAGILLAVAAAAYPVLVAAYGWRFARYRREFLADATDPVKAFAFFTFVAGSNVLGTGLAAYHLTGITTGLWSIVFPLGMYGVASRELGTAARVSWLVTIGRYETWIALAAWVAVFAGMTSSLVTRRRRAPARDREAL